MSQTTIGFGRWFWLVLITLAFLHLFVFIQLPVTIFLESEANNASQLPALTQTLGLWSVISLLGIGVLTGLLGWPVRHFLAPLLLALALTYWLVDSFFARSYPNLDGAMTQLPVDSFHGWVQGLVLLGFFVLLLATRRKLETPLLWFIAALTLLNGFWVMRTLSLIPSAEMREAVNADEFFRLSTQQNVLVVLMDTFQSEYLEEALAIRPGLIEELQGFTYFPDTVGVASSTFMSMPAIHSGKAYDPIRTMAAYFDESIRHESVLTALVQAGFDASLLNPMRHVCPQGANCLARDDLLRSDPENKMVVALHLLDVSLMRSAPEPLKNTILNEGHFLLGQKFGPASLSGDALVVWDDARILEQFGDRLTIDDGPSRVRFLHLMNTHPPFVLDAGCSAVEGENHDNGSRQSALQQVVCAVDSFAQVLQSLRAKGVFDQTLIVLLGDHGASSVYADESLFSRRLETSTSTPEVSARLVGSANPLLLVKPPFAKGPMQTDLRPADLTDIPATICGRTASCQWQTGWDLFLSKANQSRERTFMSYRWEHRFWELGYIPELDFYTITGPVSQWRSWLAEKAVVRTEIAAFNFGDDDHNIEFGPGWGVSEVSPAGKGMRWALGKQLRLQVNLETTAEAAAAYQFNFNIWVPEFNSHQAMIMELNGHELELNDLPPGNHKVTYRVSGELLAEGENEVLLHFSQVSGLSEQDERQFAVVLSGLTVERIGSRPDQLPEHFDNSQ